MKKIAIVLAGIIILILIFTIYPQNKIIGNVTPGKNIGEQVQQKEKTEVEIYQENEIENQENNFVNRVSEGSSGGGGSGAGSSVGGTDPANEIPPNCQETQISYSLRKFVKNQTCNIFEGEICTDKNSFCSIEVKNLDDDITGIFTISFTHFELQNPENIIETESESFTLSPNEMRVFSSEIQIQSSGMDGNANKEISCTFASEEIPIKSIC